MGIGNTIVQVAASPLLQEVTPKEKLSSFFKSIPVHEGHYLANRTYHCNLYGYYL